MPSLTPIEAFDMLDNTALLAMINPSGMNYLGLTGAGSSGDMIELQTVFDFLMPWGLIVPSNRGVHFGSVWHRAAIDRGISF